MVGTGTVGVLSCALGAVAGTVCSRQISKLKLRRQLNGNYRWMSKQERDLAKALISNGNAHMFQGWPRPGVNDQAKRALLAAAATYMTQGAPALEASRLRTLVAPVPAKQPKTLEAHGDVREDPYYWLRDDKRESGAVLQHLGSENEYTQAVMSDTQGLQDSLYSEMRGRIQEADQSVAVRSCGYYYYTKTLEGQQYKVHCRRQVPQGAGPPSEAELMDEGMPEEVLLDENQRKAEGGHTFYMVGCVEPSPDQRLLAWCEDTTGNERYSLRVKDLATGKEVMAPIPDMDGDMVWAADNQHLFYVTKDQQERPHKVWRHKIGQPEHVPVFEESDESFFVGISKSRSEQVIFVECGSAVTSELRFIHADKPTSDFTLVLPRVNDVQYDARHHGDHLFIVLRDQQRPNSEVLLAKLSDLTQAAAAEAEAAEAEAAAGDAAAGEAAGEEPRPRPAAPSPRLQVLLPHSPEVKVEGLSVSRDFVVVFKRLGGLQRASVHPLPAGGSGALVSLAEGGREIAFEEPAYSLYAGSQGDFDSPVIRLHYTSLTTPSSTIDYHMATGARAVKKVQPVLGGFNKDEYVTERQWASSHDGVKVPISIVYKKSLVKLDGLDPLLLNGYGSYEVCNDPYFSANRLCLLDRGFIFAMAHIRGGGEMGRSWYEEGKYLKKKNTFLDFIACAEHLVAAKYGSPQRLAIEGRSAGGLLMGAVCNMRPELFRAAIFGVPFVDCLTTMSDETIPLTVTEWEEWGDPRKAEYYHYMKSYSPMDNIARGSCYPHMLVTGGLHDPRVGYWEPAKLVAQLREQAKPGNMLLLKMELGAGHFSVTGRFERLKEVAFEYAFLLKAMCLPETPLVAPEASSKL